MGVEEPALDRVKELEQQVAALEASLARVEAENVQLRGTAARARDQERFLESIVENLPDMIFVKDAVHLRFVRFNQAGEQLLGQARADMLGKSDADLFPKEDAEFFLRKDREVLSTGKPVEIAEEPIHTPSGLRYLHTKKIPVLDDAGVPIYLLGISEDVTERRLAAERLAAQTAELSRAHTHLVRAGTALRASEARLRVLLEHLPGAMWTADPSLRFLSTAGALAEPLGLRASRVQGEPLDAWLKPAGPGQDVLELHRLALEGEPQTYEFRALDRTFEVRVERLGSTAAEGVLGLALDVTERRRVEEERMRGRLERAQKLEMLGLLAGGIAHDFNNLLTVILGNASLALMRLSAADPARRPMERVEQSAQNAADLTRQLLAYSGKGRFVIEPVDLSALVEEMGSLLRVSISKKAVLKFDLRRGMPRCEADASQLRQILINLITNASDALEGRPGTITLATGEVAADRAYLDKAWLDEDLPEGLYVWMEVSDTGVGMDLSTQNHMFDPFFTTKPRGHGLGLSATLGVVRGHRGAIRVYSEPGRGTTIKVLFPATGGGVVVAPPEPRRLPDSPSLGRVLVVDDEEDIREFARDTLEGAGFEVATAFDGVDALEVFTAGAFDAVVLDMTMPRLGGEEAFREIRRVAPTVRVLLSSGYNEQDATSRFAGKGLAGFLQKPYTAAQLLERVRGLVTRGS